MTTSIWRFFLNTMLTATCFMGLAISAWAADVVIIGTGAAAVENVFKKIEFPLNRTRNIKMDIVAAGPVQAWKDLDAGKVHCAVGGVGFADWVELMKKGGYGIPDPSVYRSWVIGQDRIKVLTNTDIPVASLSKEQLQGIFSGSIKNWSEVKGPDKPILVILGTRIPGTVSVFQKNIMGNAEFTKNAMPGTTAEDVKSRVIRNPGAISFGTISQVDYQVNSPDTPEIKRPITLITKGQPSGALLKMIDFIEKDGQRYIIK